MTMILVRNRTSRHFSYSRSKAHLREPQPVDEKDGYARSADPDRPDDVSDREHPLPARCCCMTRSHRYATIQMVPPVRERRPLGSSPGGARHSPPEAGGVAYRRTPGWFPSRHCPHPRRWRSRARPRFRSVSIAPLAPLRGTVPTGGRPSSPGGGSLACASLHLVVGRPSPCAASGWRLLRLGERSRV